MTRTSPGPRSLADDLRARTDGELATLLRIRPDLVVPVPVDVAQLASRGATRASAVRALAIGGPTTSYVLQCLAWCSGILVVFAPLAVIRYRRTV
jgi:hypothetical protein